MLLSILLLSFNKDRLRSSWRYKYIEAFLLSFYLLLKKRRRRLKNIRSSSLTTAIEEEKRFDAFLAAVWPQSKCNSNRKSFLCKNIYLRKCFERRIKLKFQIDNHCSIGHTRSHVHSVRFTSSNMASSDIHCAKRKPVSCADIFCGTNQ